MEQKIDGRKTRTIFFRKYKEYEPTWEFKEYFLSKCKEELNEHRYNAMRNLMYKVARWERRYGKDVYDFSLEQLKGMLKEFDSTSEMSLMSQKSNLEYYLWFAKKIANVGDTNTSAAITLTLEEIRDFVSIIGSEQRYISRDELYDLVTTNLVNYVDQALILLIFESVMGKANQDLIDLEWRNIDFQNCIVKSGDKLIQITSELADILEKANNQTEYLMSNGQVEENSKRSKLEIMDKYDSPYLFRPMVSKAKDNEKQVSASAIQRRVLNSCKLYLDKPYLTLSSIYISGLADRGVRHSFENYGGEMMRNTDWQKFLKQNDERVNLQDSYKLYKEFMEKELSQQQED